MDDDVEKFLVDHYIAWQLQTMFHAMAAAKRQESGDKLTISDAERERVFDQAESIRNRVAGNRAFVSHDEMALCTESTFRWCAEEMGLILPEGE